MVDDRLMQARGMVAAFLLGLLLPAHAGASRTVVMMARWQGYRL